MQSILVKTNSFLQQQFFRERMEIIRLQSICRKLSEHIEVMDESSKNLSEICKGQSGGTFINNYQDLLDKFNTFAAHHKEIVESSPQWKSMPKDITVSTDPESYQTYTI